MQRGVCDNSQLGRFILDLPQGMSVNQTSFWSARVSFSSGNDASTPPDGEVGTSGFWDNPEGNPHPPDEYSEHTSPWRRRELSRRDSLDASFITRQDGDMNPSPSGVLSYRDPIQYLVRKTGYYCVGTLIAFR